LKKIEGLTADEKKTLVMLLETATPQTRTTIKDIRQIDKICTVLETGMGGDVDLEDTDFAYLKQRIGDFSGWVPKGRKEVIALADKLGI